MSWLLKTLMILSIANANIISVLQMLNVSLTVLVSCMFVKAFKIENAEKINAIPNRIMVNQL